MKFLKIYQDNAYVVTSFRAKASNALSRAKRSGDVMQFQYTFLASLNNIELHVGLHDVSTKIDALLVLVNKGSILHL